MDNINSTVIAKTIIKNVLIETNDFGYQRAVVNVYIDGVSMTAEFKLLELEEGLDLIEKKAIDKFKEKASKL